MQLFTATFVKNKCKFLRFLVQQKLALVIINNFSYLSLSFLNLFHFDKVLIGQANL